MTDTYLKWVVCGSAGQRAGTVLQEALREVLELQLSYSSANTPEMRRRGVLIRDDLPRRILEQSDGFKSALGQYGFDLGVEGSDGTGLKAIVPWVRVFSRHMSPAATTGWYLVYLFHPDGSGVSLCLSHGSTIPQDGNFKARSKAEAKALMTWAASVADIALAGDPATKHGIELGRYRLAAAYESTTLISKFYRADAIPYDGELLRDVGNFAELLARLYSAHDAGLTPGTSSPEVIGVLQVAEDLASPFKQAARGQGWGLDYAARVAVEHQAMRLAEQWLVDQEFAFRDVSSTDSCDFRAERHGEPWVIEVKGTTGGPSSILLTRNEVDLHDTCYPKNALLIIHGIKLSTDGTSAAGGTLLAISPWKIDRNRLRPTAYEYLLD